MNIPFDETCGIWRRDANTERRAEIYSEFMGKIQHPSLDVGHKNYIGDLLKIEDNTLECDFNFNVVAVKDDYKTITCFEVIEHVMNPLAFMVNLKRLLDKDGKIYLSTPVIPFISRYQWSEHFTEYKEKPFDVMLRYAGFRVVSKKVFRPFKWWFYFTGFRPFARLIMKNVIYELEHVN